MWLYSTFEAQLNSAEVERGMLVAAVISTVGG